MPHNSLAAILVARRSQVLRIILQMILDEVKQKVESIESGILEPLAQPVLLILVGTLPVCRALALEALVGYAQIQSVKVQPEGKVGHSPTGYLHQLRSQQVALRHVVSYLPKTLHHLLAKQRHQKLLFGRLDRRLHLLPRERRRHGYKRRYLFAVVPLRL